MIALLLFAAGLAVTPPPTRLPDPPPSQTAEPGPLGAALDDARSDAPARHERLLGELQSREFLETVDSQADYAEAARRGLHVGQIVNALAGNPMPSAQRAFERLTTSKIFLAHDERAIALIRASARVGLPPPELVRFWDRRSQPDDGFTPTTIGVLVDNGSEPALRLLERKLAEAGHSDDEKKSWMHVDVLRHRNDPALLRACERLLAGSLPKRLRPALVESLFDYRPGEWFKPGGGASAPPLATATATARAELRKLGELALRTAGLAPPQKAAVSRRLKELDALGDAPAEGPR
jgi:hypothetical protein